MDPSRCFSEFETPIISVDAQFGATGAKLLTHVEFRSDRFGALEGEEELINPDLWGKQLADFLKAGLDAEGFETTEPIAEDWGWALKIKNEPLAFWIGVVIISNTATATFASLNRTNLLSGNSFGRLTRKIESRRFSGRWTKFLQRRLASAQSYGGLMTISIISHGSSASTQL